MEQNLNLFSKLQLGITKQYLFYTVKNELGQRILKQENKNITHAEILQQIQNIKFNVFYQSTGGPNNKSSTLENAKLPPFSYLYYYLFITCKKIPSLELMVTKYLQFFCTTIENNEDPDLVIYGLKPYFATKGQYLGFTKKQLGSRICRAYNSFNRELELLYRLFQQEDIQVKYSFQYDYVEGIDILVNYNNKIQGIACYQESKNSQYYYKLKHTSRRTNKFPIIEMAMNNNNSISIGEVKIFNNSSYDLLIHKIKESEQIVYDNFVPTLEDEINEIY